MSIICMVVTNSVKKDPRVQKEALSAYAAGHKVTVVGLRDSNYDPDFIKNVPYKIVLIDSLKNIHKRFSPLWFLSGVNKALTYNKRFIREIIKVQPQM